MQEHQSFGMTLRSTEVFHLPAETEADLTIKTLQETVRSLQRVLADERYELTRARYRIERLEQQMAAIGTLAASALKP